MIEQGPVVAVQLEVLGSNLVVDAPVGSMQLSVGTTEPDFSEDGGQVLVGTEVLTYTSLDDTLNVLFLSVATTMPHYADDRVDVYPSAEQTWAYVQVGDDDDEAVIAEVPHALLPLLPTGTYDPDDYVQARIEDAGGFWSVLDITGSPPSMDFGVMDPATIPPVPPTPLTDGLPPASSPTPVVSSGLNSIFASWAAITNHDTVIYEVHLSATSGFSPSSGTKAGEVSGTMFQITTLPGGGALVAATNYYVKIVAKDPDGPAPASTQGGPVQITVLSSGTIPPDGVVPPVATGLALDGALGILNARWLPVVNKDFVTYEVHLSTTNNFVPGAGTKCGETSGTTWVFKVDAAGAALVYGTTYRCKVIAKDADGSAAASAQASAALQQINTGDIANNAVTGTQIADGSVLVNDLSAGNLDNACPDPSFEYGTEWSGFGGEWSRVTADPANAHTGTCYARKNSGYTGSNGPFTSNFFTVTDTDIWYGEVWIYRDALVTSGNMSLYVFCYDAANAYLGPKNIQNFALTLLPASTWVKVSGVTPLVAGTSKIRFAAYANPNAGEVRLDDFYYKRAGMTADRFIMGNFDNLVENPGLEAGNISWNINQPGWSIVNDAANARTGSWVLERAGQAAASAAKNVNLVDCKPGDQFYIEAYAKGDASVAGTAYVRITWINAAGAEITYAQSAAPALTGAYALLSVTGTAPANAVKARGDVVAGNTAGIAFFDDLYFHRVLVTPFFADQSIVTAKIADAALTTAKFAAGIRPVTVVSALPANPYTGYLLGDPVVNTADGKLYRMTNLAGAGTSGWTAAVPTVDLTGTISNAQLGAGAVDATKFVAGLRPVGIVSALPANPYTGYILNDIVTLTTDSKTYKLTNVSAPGTTGWTSAVSASDITGQITTTQIADNAITTPKIVANAVTAAQIAANTITAAQIAADTITAGQIAAGAITSSELAAGAVIAGKIAAGVVTANEIAANTITSAQIAADTITAGQIAAGAITSSELAAGAVIAGKIAAGVITSVEIAADTITAGNIAAGAITASELAANSVYTAALQAGAVTAATIAAHTITAAQIAAGTITATEIGADVIVAGNIAAGAITTSELATGAVTAVKVTAGTLTSNEIAALTIQGTNIAGQTITAAKLVVDDILAGQIMAIQMQSSMIQTASSGQRVVLDISGLTEYDPTGVPIISFPTDPGQDAYIKAAIDAITLNVLQGLVMKGTNNILESGAVLTLRNGIKAPVAKPVLKVVWPDRVALPSVFDPSGQAPTATCIEYAAAGFGAQATYVIGWQGVGTDGSTQYQVVEYKAADMTQLRIIKDWGWGIAHGIGRDSTNNVYVISRFVNAFNLTKYDNVTSPAVQLANRDISADFPNATWGGLFLASDGTTLYIFEASQAVNWQTGWRYATVTLSNAGAWTKSAVTNLATTTSNIFSAKDFEVAESRVWMTMTSDPVNGTITTSWTLAGVWSGNFDFTGPGALTCFTHDGTTFRSIVGQQIILHSTWVWTTASAKYWVGTTWHEDTGPAPSGTWTNVDLESPESPISSITMIRRAKLSVGAPVLPNPYSAGGLMYVSAYMAPGASDPGSHKRQGFGSSTPTQVLATYDSAGPLRAAAGEGVFPSGVNAALQTDDGSPLIRANGIPRMRTQSDNTQLPKSIANNTLVALNVWRQNLSLGDVDTDGFFSIAGSTAIKIPFAGQYLLACRVNWAAGAVTGYRQINIQQSTDAGTNWANTPLQSVEAAAPSGNSQNLVGILNYGSLGSPDTRIRVAVQHTDGAALNVTQTLTLALVYLGPN